MPLRKFECHVCGNTFERIIKGKKSKCPKCDADNVAKLPTELSTATYEMRDKYHGKQIRKGQEARMRKRMNDHHNANEIAEKIDKYGMDDAQRHGWLKKIKKI